MDDLKSTGPSGPRPTIFERNYHMMSTQVQVTAVQVTAEIIKEAYALQMSGTWRSPCMIELAVARAKDIDWKRITASSVYVDITGRRTHYGYEVAETSERYDLDLGTRDRIFQFDRAVFHGDSSRLPEPFTATLSRRRGGL